MELDIQAVEKALSEITRDKDPVKWSSLMNMKGMILRNQGDYKAAESTFISALYVDDPILKCKVLINYAQTEFLKKDITRALQVVDKVFEVAKANKKANLNPYLGFAHLLKGQILYMHRDDKSAINEFLKAEFFFEVAKNIRGVGLACLEVARVHIKAKTMTHAWNFLRKAENFLRKLGDEEKLGVALCKGIALYYSDKAEEAMAILMEACKEQGMDSGKYRYLIDEILDAYLDTHGRMLMYQQSLM